MHIIIKYIMKQFKTQFRSIHCEFFLVNKRIPVKSNVEIELKYLILTIKSVLSHNYPANDVSQRQFHLGLTKGLTIAASCAVKYEHLSWWWLLGKGFNKGAVPSTAWLAGIGMGKTCRMRYNSPAEFKVISMAAVNLSRQLVPSHPSLQVE